MQAGDGDGDGDGDHDMADVSRGDPSAVRSPRPRRYRLRKHLLMKRARTLGNMPGGGGAASSATPSGGGLGSGKGKKRRDDAWMFPPRMPLPEVVGMCTGGPNGRREGEAGHDPDSYALFVDLVERMLDHRPETRWVTVGVRCGVCGFDGGGPGE